MISLKMSKQLQICVFLSLLLICMGDDGCSPTTPTTAACEPKEQTTPPNEPPNNRDDGCSPTTPTTAACEPKEQTTPPNEPPTATPQPPPPNTSPPGKSPPEHHTKKPPPPPTQKNTPDDQPPTANPPPKNQTDTNCSTQADNDAICKKATEPAYKNNPFCPNSGDADDGCKGLSDAVKGTNPKCYQINVCTFTTKEGNPAYVCSKDMSGVTLIKGCNNDVSIITKPRKNPGKTPKPSPDSDKQNKTTPSASPKGKCPTDHDQNLICVKAAEDQFKNNPFCKSIGEADEGCKQLSDVINGSNPSCCQNFVCSFKTQEGAEIYICSKDMTGVNLLKGCHNDISVISKPDENAKIIDKDNNDTEPTCSPSSNTPSEHEQNLICVKAAEDQYKNNPFCESTGGADEGCKQLSVVINGSNPSCCQNFVCSFKTKEGVDIYISSKDMTGVNLLKGCHNDISVISKPDENAKIIDKDNDTEPTGSPSSNTPSEHEQNIICVKAAEDQYKNNPFCKSTGGADEGCKQLSDVINGSNPSCCQNFVCSFKTKEGADVYISSKDMTGVNLLKECHNDISVISKPDESAKIIDKDKNGTEPTGSPSSNTPSEHEQNIICFKAADKIFTTGAFCDPAGAADDKCKILSDAVNGSNPSCCKKYVCTFTSSGGAPYFLLSRNISGVTVQKKCHNNVMVISKPEDDGDDNNISIPTTKQPATDPQETKSSPSMGSPSKQPDEDCSTTTIAACETTTTIPTTTSTTTTTLAPLITDTPDPITPCESAGGA